MYLIFLAYLCLATAISVNKVILQVMPTTLFVGIRTLLAGLLMVMYVIRTSPRLRIAHLKHDWWKLLAAALFTTYVPSLLKAFALKYMFSSKATLLGSCDPFVTALYAYILWQDKLSWHKIAGILIGFFGMAITIVSTSPVEHPWHAWAVFSYPELAALGAVFIGRFGWILIRSLLRKERYTPFEINGVSMVGSGLLALMTSYQIDQWHKVSIPMTLEFGALMAYTIIVGNILGYTLYAYVVKHNNVTLVSLAGFTVPIIVGIIGWLVLGEPISANFLISAACVFIGLIIFYKDELKK